MAGSSGMSRRSFLAGLVGLETGFMEEAEASDTNSRDYPYKIIDTEVNSTDVRLVGVKHTPSFFSEYEEFFEEEIENVDATLMEGEDLSKNKEIKNKFNRFFASLEDLAGEKGKPVYKADPRNHASFDLDKAVAGISFTIPLISYNRLVNYKRLRDAVSEEKLSRRKLLINGGIASLAAYLFMGNMCLDYSLDLLNGKESDFGWRDRIIYGHTDYGNVGIADGIEEIAYREPVDSILGIHGRIHTEPIAGYLEEENLQEIKNTMYAPYDLIGEDQVRKYVYEDGWDLAKTF